MTTFRKFTENVMYYTIIFFIINEWLRPVMVLTDTGYFELFSLFVVLCLVLALLKTPLLISWLIKLVYISAFITYIYGGLALFSAEGVRYLLAELQLNSKVLVTGDVMAVTDPIRTSLFFLLIWMLVYLIHYWVAVRMTIFYFFVMTVFFIATLDTFTVYDGSVAIVKVVLLGLLMTALLFFKRLVVTTKSAIHWRMYMLYALSVVLLIGFAGGLALLLPKAGPQWADPVPFLKSATGQGGSEGAQSGAKVGYRENDERLGGPFEPDDMIVFQIEVPDRQYWRIETREEYTSKGWVSAETQLEINEQLRLTGSGSGRVNEDAQYAFVQALTSYPFLLQPYRTAKYDAGEYVQYLVNPLTERVDTLVDGRSEPIPSYTVEYYEPQYSYTTLKEVTTSLEAGEQYLQLPDSLPQRVRDLALELTAEADSVYDKARAVEGYFQRSGFRYETQDVPFPDETQDYVDQFLFETKYGYCDNFSTAMVVLMRAAGVEARWVKGFTGGQEIARDREMRTFEVSNNNAHSWVEVYIDGVGWMPFEPTIGYSNDVNIDYDMDTSVADTQEVERPEQERVEEEIEQAATQNGGGVKASLLASIALAVVAFLYWLWKRRPANYLKMTDVTKEQPIQQASTLYEQLLQHLAKQGLKRASHETLQQFAKRVDRTLNTEHMSVLTTLYERSVYSKQVDEADIKEMKEVFEYLINRLGS